MLGELDAKLLLVTSGFRRLQDSKIRALGFASLFEAIHVDAIDEAERKGKEGISTRNHQGRKILTFWRGVAKSAI
jgi:putative hydrolase of the HAD superfamily